MVKYDSTKKCFTFWTWLYYTWDYTCKVTGEREIGYRLFGVARSNGKCTCGE